MTEADALMEQVKFGIEVESFQNSSIGQYLIKRAADEITVAREKLDDVDPEDAKAIRKLQNDIYCAKSFLAWLKWAIEDGLSAEQTLTGE